MTAPVCISCGKDDVKIVVSGKRPIKSELMDYNLCQGCVSALSIPSYGYNKGGNDKRRDISNLITTKLEERLAEKKVKTSAAKSKSKDKETA